MPRTTSESLEKEVSFLDAARQFREPLNKDTNNPITRRKQQKEAAVRAALAMQKQAAERGNLHSLIKLVLPAAFAVGLGAFFYFVFFSGGGSDVKSEGNSGGVVSPAPRFE
jgi:hypothetical protein